MYYSNKKRLSELWKQFLDDAKIMREAGMSDDAIQELKRIVADEYNSDRRFYRIVGMYIDPEDDIFPTLLLPYCRPDIMDEIDNPRLFAALMKLSEDERRIVILRIEDGLSLKLIAALQGKPYDRVKKQYSRAIEKIKKFF